MTPSTLEEIAALAGVSRATVSRVINGRPRVSQATRDKVLRIIREQGYHPNHAARALASRRSQTIGLASAEAPDMVFSHAYLPLLVQGIASACDQRGYKLLLTPLASQTPERMTRALRSGQVDGLVVATAAVGDAFLGQLLDEGFPFILVGKHPPRPEIVTVSPDNLQGARMAADHLVRLGYRSIATITGRRTLGASIERREGFLDAIREKGRDVAPQHVVESDFTEEGGYRAMRRLLGTSPRPDAVFCGSDLMAIGAMRAVQDAGLRVPEDVAFVGFDDVPIASLVHPPLTTVRQPIVRLGGIAAGMLIDMLESEPMENGQPYRPESCVLPVELVIRGSCGRSRPMA